MYLRSAKSRGWQSSTKVIPWKYLVFYTCVRQHGGLKFSGLYSLINYDRPRLDITLPSKAWMTKGIDKWKKGLLTDILQENADSVNTPSSTFSMYTKSVKL